MYGLGTMYQSSEGNLDCDDGVTICRVSGVEAAGVMYNERRGLSKHSLLQSCRSVSKWYNVSGSKIRPYSSKVGQ